ncbi:ATP-binding protein [Aeromicrobium sp. YIM 150415]|uniref:sensor histidine kinase n=1 Tax=Aeromicrobium sp. YIM 150415 TaxID=2803912 RepID=UPI001964795B|nr:ATP-binding protein [Aeromicrobium sp. YIM 150415]MBM9462385.1 ATP-binding protein [Aeromicrobium sp. YIM 150415]
MEASASYVIVGMLGVVLGAALAWVWRFSESRQQTLPPSEEPLVPRGVEDVLAVLSSSAVLLDSSDTVVQASAPAIALGVVAGDELRPPELAALARDVQRDGQVREADLMIRRRRRAPLNVHARVAPLTSSLRLVLIQDRTRERQVETIRRDFVANVSHELKTPIGAINLLAEAVGEAADDPEAVVRFSARMRAESDRLTRLVQQIIDLSRLQNDTASDDTAVVKVDELIAEAVEHSTTAADGREIEITVNSLTELAVYGDRAQLHSAVSNLVENAVTYSDRGGRVAISAERAGEDVRITVSDTGIGIPDEELERIFERFYRVDPARARATGGTGLGLSIVKHVAASNGGTVEVWSEPGVGSSFTLVLPAPGLEEEHM